jgi:predicted transcriptional regulator of viral defense system
MQLLETAVQKLGPIFTIEQLFPLAKEQKISRKQLTWLMSTLASSGRIEILKRGTYAVKSHLFAGEIPPFAVAAALVQPMAISHWSALAEHGFTTQMPVMVQASTTRNVITPEMRNGEAYRPRGRAVWQALDTEFEFIHVQEKQFFGHMNIWVNNWQQVAITNPERTALDVIARPDVFGGTRAALEIFGEALPRIQASGLVDYALRYNVGAVVKRVGWALEQFGVPESETEPLRDFPVKTYYRLDPQLPPGDQYNTRWRILENLRVA